MKIEWHRDARQDLEELDENVKAEVLRHVKSLRKAPLGENTSIVSKQGLEVFRLKVKEEGLDHRVFFDIDGQEVIVLGVMHRDQAYTNQSLEKVKRRQ